MKNLLLLLIIPFLSFGQCDENQLIYFNDFEKTNSLESVNWAYTELPFIIDYSYYDTILSDTITTNILGNFGSETISWFQENLPNVDSITIEFDLYIFDSWDGIWDNDIWGLQVNGEGGYAIINTSFSNSGCFNNQSYPENIPEVNPDYSNAYLTLLPNLYYSEPNSCGNPSDSNSALYLISKTIPYTSDDLGVWVDNSIIGLQFFANGLGSPQNESNEESWGIDNLRIYGHLVCGCLDETACNFNPDAAYDDDSCIYPDEYYDCDGNCLDDIDGDGICDELECLTVLCEFGYECILGWCVCINDMDLDEICDEEDNCPNNYNPYQEDNDGDGLGDECDPFPLSINEENNNTRQLLKVIDPLGRETTNKGFQLHIYDDGSVEKKYIIK